MSSLNSVSYDKFIVYCEQLYQKNKVFDAEQLNRLDRHRNLEPESAKFLASLAIAKQASTILEIGTSSGFSTLWLAHAANIIGSPTLISIDIDQMRSEIAREHLQKVGLDKQVQLQIIDAKDFLSTNSQKFELIFLDAERQFYRDYIDGLHAALRVSSILVVDNVLSHASEVSDFLKLFEQDDRYLCHTLPIGAGLFIAVKQTEAS